MLIDKKVTKKIAFLARIGLSEKEEEEFSKDLSNILKWMEDLKQLLLICWLTKIMINTI